MLNQDHWDKGFKQVGDTDWARKSWSHFGMEYVDPKYVVVRHPVTDTPLVAVNPDDGKISVDPRYIDSEKFFEDIYAFFNEELPTSPFKGSFEKYLK